jgi:hypothetical protein
MRCVFAGSLNVKTPNSVLIRKLIADTIPSSNSVRIAVAFALPSIAEISPTVFWTSIVVV